MQKQQKKIKQPLHNPILNPEINIGLEPDSIEFESSRSSTVPNPDHNPFKEKAPVKLPPQQPPEPEILEEEKPMIDRSDHPDPKKSQAV